MNAEQFVTQIIRPTLMAANYWSKSAENLLLATALCESELQYLRQLGGPALGFYQCEPTTYEDVKEYIIRDPKKVSAVLNVSGFTAWPEANALMWNLRYATMICRMHYWRIVEPLPEHDDFNGLCKYYLKHYNTCLGKATFEKSIGKFRESCII